MSSFISASRSVPPARTDPLSPSSTAICSFFVGVAYSNCCMSTSFFQCRENAIGGERQERHAHADGVGHCVRDRRAWRNHWRLSQSDDATLVVAFASHHVDLEFANVIEAGETIELEVRVQHDSGDRIQNLLLVERVAN